MMIYIKTQIIHNMKIFFLSILIFLNSAFSGNRKNDLNTPKIDIEIKKEPGENNLYRLSVYNNSDSVLCFISSSFGNYKKDSVSELIPWSKPNDENLIYKIDYTLGDTKFDPFLPLKSKVCILPYQEISFTINLAEIKLNMTLSMEYFYSDTYNYPKSQKETKKPLWYNKYQRQSINVKIP